MNLFCIQAGNLCDCITENPTEESKNSSLHCLRNCDFLLCYKYCTSAELSMISPVPNRNVISWEPWQIITSRDRARRKAKKRGCAGLFRRTLLYGKIYYSENQFTRQRVSPLMRKPTTCLAAANPALMLASAVCAPAFLGVAK